MTKLEEFIEIHGDKEFEHASRAVSELDEDPPDSPKQSDILGKEFIEHYGVKGMQWGVRRSRSQLRKANKKRESTEAKRAKQIKKKAKKSGVSSLTNKELGDLNKRMQLEQQFNNLNPKTSAYKKGTGFAQEVLKVGNMGNQAYNLATSPAAKVIQESLKKK